MKIIFICLGNICRSPIAEGVAKNLVKERNLDYTIKSAGTGSWHIGDAPCPDSIKIAKQRGVDISKQRAKQVTQDDFREFDLIIALDSKNKADLDKINPTDKEVILLGSFGFDGADVPDPYFFDGFEGFDKVFDMIETAVTNLFDEIEKKD